VRRLIGGLVLTAVAVSGCTSSDGDEEATADFRPAAAPAVGVPLLRDGERELRIGVVVTESAARGEGTEFAAPAAGARVAEFRLDQEGDRVSLEVVDDRGTAEGSVAAVRQLVDAGVAGIVYASAGAHLDPGLEAAADAGTAVLLPYDTREDLAGETAWRTGPSDEQVADRIASVLAEQGQRAPVTLTEDGTGDEPTTPPASVRRVALTPGDALPGQVAAAAAALTEGGADGVVIDASAETSAEAVAALQGLAPALPVVLGPAALTPAFAARLADLGSAGGATTAGQFQTVGTAVADSSPAPAVAGFLAAVRLAAQDAGVPALVGRDSFAGAGAATADIRSHDAVMAIATAAAQAESAEPSAVLGALRGLTVDVEDGLAGPELDFGRSQALALEDVAVLQATNRAPGRGFGTDEPALAWFVLPLGR
jgi:ABC-type branched-subunit amino acid transport system substrate-binding protein